VSVRVPCNMNDFDERQVIGIVNADFDVDVVKSSDGDVFSVGSHRQRVETFREEPTQVSELGRHDQGGVFLPLLADLSVEDSPELWNLVIEEVGNNFFPFRACICAGVGGLLVDADEDALEDVVEAAVVQLRDVVDFLLLLLRDFHFGFFGVEKRTWRVIIL
jgi:hypothetical protein